MEQNQITVYTSDGEKQQFTAGGKLNINREQLLITLQTSESITGWHWDHMVCIVQHTPGATQQPSLKTCGIELVFPNGKHESISIGNFQGVEIKMANSLIIIRGAVETALVNPDFLNWYTVRKDK